MCFLSSELCDAQVREQFEKNVTLSYNKIMPCQCVNEALTMMSGIMSVGCLRELRTHVAGVFFFVFCFFTQKFLILFIGAGRKRNLATDSTISSSSRKRTKIIGIIGQDEDSRCEFNQGEPLLGQDTITPASHNTSLGGRN